MVCVGILDTSAEYAVGIAKLARRCGFRVAGQWHEPEAAWQALKTYSAHVLLLGEELAGAYCSVWSRERRRETALIVTMRNTDSKSLLAVRSLGFRGLLLRSADQRRILECLGTVASGQSWLDPELYHRFCHSADLGQLTARETEIARLAASGNTNKVIARQLRLSDGTVKIHLHHIFGKLHVNKRADLAMCMEEAS